MAPKHNSTSQRQAEPVRLQCSQTSTCASYGALSPDRFSDAIPCRSGDLATPRENACNLCMRQRSERDAYALLQTGRIGLAVPLLQSSVVSFARVQGLPVEQNVRKSFEDAQQKSKMLEPDAVIYFPERSQWVDFSVTDPTAPSALSKNMIEVGSAMNARADLKNAKYLRKAQSMDADFSPLVLTHYGKRDNLDLIKGNAAHAAKVKSRVWLAWHRNKERRDRQAG